jgi:hypothetical protein
VERLLHDDVVAVVRESRAHGEILAHGYTRRPLPVDAVIARTLGELAHAAWDLPRDQYYETGDRFRSLNRYKAQIAADGVWIRRCDDGEPYVQLEKYNPTLGGKKRVYSPLPAHLADAVGVRRMMAYHLMYLPLSVPGTRYTVNMHVIRFAASPGRPADTSPPGLHKDGEKYLATHLLGRCGAGGGEVVITDNQHQELDRFTMRETGECYVFDDERIWHMLTPVSVLDGNEFAYRDTVAFDLLPEGWEP